MNMPTESREQKGDSILNGRLGLESTGEGGIRALIRLFLGAFCLISAAIPE
jgi:hypothetical protein